MATPDVRVRLSAEGTAEVLAAFRKVQAESERAAKGGSKAFAGFGSSLISMRGLIAGVATAVAGLGLARIASQASDAAEGLQNLRLRFASTVSDLSALSVAARRTGSDIGTLARPLTRLFDTMSDASKDLSGEAADKFRELGLSTREIQAFASQGLSGRLETFAAALAKLPDGPKKAADQIQLLGDRGSALLPILDQIGSRGFAALRDQADALSALMSEEMVQAVGAVNDSFDDLRIQSEGLATQFLTGLAPGIVSAMKAINEEATSGARGWRIFGEVVGNVLGFIAVGVTTAFDSIHTRLTTLAANFASLFRAIGAAATGKMDEARVHMEAIGLRRAKNEEDLAERVNRSWDRFLHREDLRARERGDLNDEGNANTERKEQEATRARITARRAGIDAELALVRAGLKLREQSEEDAFEAGLRSVASFYAARRQIVLEGIAAEIAALQRQRVLAVSDKEKGLAEVRKLDGQIAALAVSRSEQVADLTAKEAAATRKLAEERLALDQRIFELRGNQHAATLLAIEEEIAKAEQLFAKLGGDEAENQRKIAVLRSALEAAAEFDRVQVEAQRALGDLARERSEIERRQSAGLTSQEEATRSIAALEEERLGRLRVIADELVRAAQATGDEERIRRALDFAASVDEVTVSLEANNAELKRLGSEGISIAKDELAGFLSTGIRQAPTFGAAIVSMAASAGAAIQRLIAQIVALRIVSAVLGLFGGSVAGVKGIAGQAPDTFFASEGGTVPGSGQGDSQPAVLEPREFVVRRAVATQPGIASFLEALNDGLALPALSAPRALSGGPPLETPTAGAPVGLNATLELAEGLVVSHLESSAGERAIIRVLSRNRRAASRALGR